MMPVAKGDGRGAGATIGCGDFGGGVVGNASAVVESARTCMHDKQIPRGCTDAMRAGEFAQSSLYGTINVLERPPISCRVRLLIRVTRVEGWLHEASQFGVGIAL